MTAFILRFLVCNLIITGIIAILSAAKRIFKNTLSGRMHYHLWFVLLGLLTVPFLPSGLSRFPNILSQLGYFLGSPISIFRTEAGSAPHISANDASVWLNDFSLSINSKTTPLTGYVLSAVWICGMFATALSVFRASLHLYSVKKSALPLQNPEIRRLYLHCLAEMKISKDIPVYTAAFLNSHVVTGFLRPGIYLPLHLISAYNRTHCDSCSAGADGLRPVPIRYIRYILLHELQHYKHKDTLTGHLMNLAGIIYWFNPFVWFALKEMRNDREIACDTSVLDMLDESEIKDYGYALINYAESISLSAFPFAAGLSGNKKQIERRIKNIVSYENTTLRKKMKSMAAFLLSACMLLSLSPFISANAARESRFQWNNSRENISYADFSDSFGEYEGSFVLYDLEKDTWIIHNMDHATLRSAPDSTYKIYDALFALEEGIITPDNSFIAWDKKAYPFEAWNTSHTLTSAMRFSVNWYFQTLDKQLGAASVRRYLQQIGYGNENMSGTFPAYWLESSLKISPVEQVQLLRKLHNNSFGFASENISAVKEAICLSSSESGHIYGKTGTGRVDNQDVNGWFVGFGEFSNRTFFFAAHINADKNASGSKAAEITMSVLHDLGIPFQSYRSAESSPSRHTTAPVGINTR